MDSTHIIHAGPALSSSGAKNGLRGLLPWSSLRLGRWAFAWPPSTPAAAHCQSSPHGAVHADQRFPYCDWAASTQWGRAGTSLVSLSLLARPSSGKFDNYTGHRTVPFQTSWENL
ncbi:hypothetical protein FDECE_6246 [Fusarium decemcellulare]|nr:hypothetical protein FDECE_6246 [Fusarium decemcellulare]